MVGVSRVGYGCARAREGQSFRVIGTLPLPTFHRTEGVSVSTSTTLNRNPNYSLCRATEKPDRRHTDKNSPSAKARWRLWFIFTR
jgi:hypothetical protein